MNRPQDQGVTRSSAGRSAGLRPEPRAASRPSAAAANAGEVDPSLQMSSPEDVLRAAYAEHGRLWAPPHPNLKTSRDLGEVVALTAIKIAQEDASVVAGRSAAFAFGDPVWPGIAKLTEECGEVLQVVGKLMMTHGGAGHWSGNLRTMLLDEVADLEAAIVFFCRHNLTHLDRQAMCRRVTAKVAKFEEWHANFDADPPPPASADTHPEDGGALAAPLVSGAVGKAETPQ